MTYTITAYIVVMIYFCDNDQHVYTRDTYHMYSDYYYLVVLLQVSIGHIVTAPARRTRQLPEAWKVHGTFFFMNACITNCTTLRNVDTNGEEHHVYEDKTWTP